MWTCFEINSYFELARINFLIKKSRNNIETERAIPNVPNPLSRPNCMKKTLEISNIPQESDKTIHARNKREKI